MMNDIALEKFLIGVKTDLAKILKQANIYTSYQAVEIVEAYFDDLVKDIRENKE